MVWFVLFLAYLFEFANGWTDAPNSIATVVSTRVMRPHHAVLMAGVLNLVGALTGTAVAKTIAEGIVDPNYVGLETVASALLAATIWALAAQYFGLPSSESHALVAGLLGAGFAAGGLEALESEGTRASLIGLVTSPLGGFLLGFGLMVLIYRIFVRVGKGHGAEGLRQGAGPVRSVHGLQSRDERCPEDDGDHRPHHRAPRGRDRRQRR